MIWKVSIFDTDTERKNLGVCLITCLSTVSNILRRLAHVGAFYFIPTTFVTILNFGFHLTCTANTNLYDCLFFSSLVPSHNDSNRSECEDPKSQLFPQSSFHHRHPIH
ncbi:hypothetical protein EYC84_002070 [Monilinia fructicola]|uniref:Uncharacterized protein n=1 Tax=Monilinia fructicola TaxID=38448 RepID=A0A5M9JTZ3_MONFR|nr:hypothetical protein EYC84_002070 [Monilinia fructicola]